MRSRAPAGPESLDLLEEAVHTLRLMPRRFLLLYYLGSVPFVLGLLYFVTDTTHSAFAAADSAPAAFTMAALFVWMQVWQAAFATRLRQHLNGNPTGHWPLRRCLRLFIAQMALSPWAWVVLPATMLMLLPWPWALAFFHNVTVLGDGTEASLKTLCRRAYQLAQLWPRQNILLLLILNGFRLCVFVNVGLSLALGPHFLKMLLGIETVFSRHIHSLENVTFLLTAWGITSLCVGPLLKAVYVLRCWYGESLHSGADLQAALRSLSLARPAGSLLPGILLLVSLSSAAVAQASPPLPASDFTPQLDRAIGEVLQQREYVWRMPRTQKLQPPAQPPLFAMVYETLKQWLQTLGKWFTQAIDWVKSFFPQSGEQSIRQRSGTPWASSLLWATGILVTAVLLAFGWWLWRRHRSVAAVHAAEAVAVSPSLRDERLTADVLPAQGWLGMAHDLWQQGEWRLAIRALHLASLAYLAQRQLLTIAAAKSNRDYARELGRKAHTRPQLLTAFAQNVSVFERVWYGTHPVNDEMVQQFHHTYEWMQTCADA